MMADQEDNGHSPLQEAVRWLTDHLTAPKRISDIIAAWTNGISDPKARAERLVLILEARRLLKVPAYQGSDDRLWWGTPAGKRE